MMLKLMVKMEDYDTAKKYDVNTILPMYEQCYTELY